MSANNNRIAKNTLFLYVRMLFVLLVSLYTSRVVLNVLGVADYGVYNVVAGFVSLFSFLNATLSSSTQRFYNFEGGREGDAGFTRVFSIALRVHLILVAVIFLALETFGTWYIGHVMVLPPGRVETAHYLFQFSVVSMSLVIAKIPFSAAILAKERMGFYAVANILEVALRLAVVLMLPYLDFDKLLVYGVMQLGVTLTDFLLNVVYAKRHFPFLRLSRHTDGHLFRELLDFSGWNLLGTVVFMLKDQGINLLLNLFFGTIVNAARGVAYQVFSAITGFSSNVVKAFTPQMVSSYATGNSHRAYSLFKTQSKICYCLLLMIITPVALEIDLVLRLWLGDAVPAGANIFTVLVLADAMIGSLNTPVTQMVFATGNIRRYQVFTSTVNIFLLPVCWLFLRSGFPAWSVFLVAIGFSIVNQAVALVAMHRVFAYSYGDYARQILFPCLSMTLLVPIAPGVVTLVMPDSFLRIVLVSMASVAATATLLYAAFLTSDERSLVNHYARTILKKV